MVIVANPTSLDASWIEKQLHQQYAENYNQISGYVLSFAIGMAGALTPYVLAFGDVLSDASVANIIRLCAADLLCVFALMVIGYLCIKQGWVTRRNQFIIFAIRTRHFGSFDKLFAVYKKDGIFSIEYHPFYKSAPHSLNKPEGIHKDFVDGLKYRPINILIGAFKYLLKVSRFCILALSIITTVTIVFAMSVNHIPDIYLWLYLLPIFGFIVPFCCFARWLWKVNSEYIDMEIEYMAYRPQPFNKSHQNKSNIIKKIYNCIKNKMKKN